MSESGSKNNAPLSPSPYMELVDEEVETPPRPRSRASTANLADPTHEFHMAERVTPSPTSFNKMRRMFVKANPGSWEVGIKNLDAQFDKRIIEFATADGEKMLAEDVHIKDESYKDRQTFQLAIKNKDWFIEQLINAAELTTIIDNSGRRLVNEYVIQMIRRYLEIVIRICLDRRNPEYLLMLAKSNCTLYWLEQQQYGSAKSYIRFEETLKEAVANKDLDLYESALSVAFGYACQIGTIISQGIDIANWPSFVWDSQNLKDILENQEIPKGIKKDNLVQNRYKICGPYFENPEIQEVLKNHTRPVYNRTRILNRLQSPGAGGGGKKTRKTIRKRRSLRGGFYNSGDLWQFPVCKLMIDHIGQNQPVGVKKNWRKALKYIASLIGENAEDMYNKLTPGEVLKRFGKGHLLEKGRYFYRHNVRWEFAEKDRDAALKEGKQWGNDYRLTIKPLPGKE